MIYESQQKTNTSRVIEKVFTHILGLCISAGLVKGTIQNIDTAYMNTNASLDKMVEVNMIDRDPMVYLNEVKSQDEPTDDEIDQAKKRMMKSQKTLERYTEIRRKKYSELDGGQAHKKNKRRFMSNATHVSKTDPDAKIAKKSDECNAPRSGRCPVDIEWNEPLIGRVAEDAVLLGNHGRRYST